MTVMQPIHDRVLVKRLPEDDTSPGGIYIPAAAKERPTRARVVAVGPGRREDGVVIPLTVAVGDVVLFGKYSGSEVKIDGEDHLIMREDDILAIC